ncbi:GGDEF domain-containing protein [Irregularibacter muris]|uniref:GGDEF domain-containing protein n=2 Tax=Irregularibacter muris TaxID=1796619 RepID=A0AAE3L3P5_9FIRM|nr:GGDEF domain-containing protein [Irregularibacter muris]
MEKKFMKVNILNGVRRIQEIFQEDNIECFIAYAKKTLTGILTKKELIGAHPNRIIADVMSDKYICVDCNIYIWEIKEIFSRNRDIQVLLVEKEEEIIGYVTRTILNVELGQYIDSLTDLYKSDYMFYNIYNLIRQDKNATIIFIDLNNFGYINKTYGHIAGDRILKSISDILKSNLGSNCYLCRYGGDEFAIVAPYSIKESKPFAEKVTKAIKAYPFLENIPVSVSIGITGWKRQENKGQNISETLINKLVNRASLASTKAKKDGNNPIIIEYVDINEIA